MARPRAARVALAYLGGDVARRGVTLGHLGSLLALLRAQYVAYQHSHWQSDGPAFYADHLLFQRLYESVAKQADELAEKMVGYFGSDGINPVGQAQAMAKWVAKWTAAEPQTRGLLSERDCQETIQYIYDELKARGVLPLGLDDWLMSTASAHEENAYLLQQRLASRRVTLASTTRVAYRYLVAGGAAPAAPSAEGAFWDNPERREVRQMADTGAVTNDPEIAADAGKAMGLPRKEVRKDVAQAKAAPPIPGEIEEDPGGEQFSTLNRYLVETEQPTPRLPDRTMQ